jgi:hypothetical protein
VRIVGKLIVASALMLLAALPARAEGSLGLDEVLTAVAAAPPLVAESKAELDKDSLKVDGGICTAVRHANHWTLVNAKSAIARFALRPTGSILTPAANRWVTPARPTRSAPRAFVRTIFAQLGPPNLYPMSWTP